MSKNFRFSRRNRCISVVDIFCKLTTAVSTLVIASIGGYAFLFYSRLSVVNEEIDAVRAMSVDVRMGVEKLNTDDFTPILTSSKDYVELVVPVKNNQPFPVSVVPRSVLIIVKNSDRNILNNGSGYFIIEAKVESVTPSYIRGGNRGSVYLEIGVREKDSNKLENIKKILRSDISSACLVSSFNVYPRFNGAYSKILRRMSGFNDSDFSSVYSLIEDVYLENNENIDRDCFDRSEDMISKSVKYMRDGNKNEESIKEFISDMYISLNDDEIDERYDGFIK